MYFPDERPLGGRDFQQRGLLLGHPRRRDSARAAARTVGQRRGSASQEASRRASPFHFDEIDRSGGTDCTAVTTADTLRRVEDHAQVLSSPRPIDHTLPGASADAAITVNRRAADGLTGSRSTSARIASSAPPGSESCRQRPPVARAPRSRKCACPHSPCSASVNSITVRRALRTRGLSVCTTMPFEAIHEQAVTSADAPSSSTKHRRQIPRASTPGRWHRVGRDLPASRAASSRLGSGTHSNDFAINCQLYHPNTSLRCFGSSSRYFAHRRLGSPPANRT